jgi:transcriptional regulator with XRE-family HTH domain
MPKQTARARKKQARGSYVPPAMHALSRTFGANVERLRLAAGLSRRALAHAAGMTDPSLLVIERGQTHPRLYYALQLARALGVPLARLIEE